MPDAGTIHQQVQARLQELEELIAPLRAELEQLSSVSAMFGSDGLPAAGASSDAKTTRRRARAAAKPTAAARAGAPKRSRRGGGGGRAQLTAKLITEQPGITASELAKAMSIAPNYLYRVLPRLEREGHITKQGKGYHPTAAAQEVETAA
ncbi:MAG TPA: MarR family transcriptional regulator [Solirubrobacteraceae bacterium]